jgi:hypothetical protein
VGGEFQDRAASAAVVSKVDALAAIVARYWALDDACGRFDVPTMVSVPSTDCVGELVSALDRLGIDAHPVTQASNAEARARAYAAVKQIDWPGGFHRSDIGWRALDRHSGGN